MICSFPLNHILNPMLGVENGLTKIEIGIKFYSSIRGLIFLPILFVKTFHEFGQLLGLLQRHRVE